MPRSDLQRLDFEGRNTRERVEVAFVVKDGRSWRGRILGVSLEPGRGSVAGMWDRVLGYRIRKPCGAVRQNPVRLALHPAVSPQYGLRRGELDPAWTRRRSESRSTFSSVVIFGP